MTTKPSGRTRRGLAHVDRDIGSRIRAARVRLGISQTALGNLLGGISFQQVQKYERGDNSVASARMKMLCEALKITPNELFGFGKEANGEPLPQLSPFAYRLAIQIDRLPTIVRSPFAQLVNHWEHGNGSPRN